MYSDEHRLDLHVPSSHSVLLERWVDWISVRIPPEHLPSYRTIKQMKETYDEFTTIFLLPVEEKMVCEYVFSIAGFFYSSMLEM